MKINIIKEYPSESFLKDLPKDFINKIEEALKDFNLTRNALKKSVVRLNIEKETAFLIYDSNNDKFQNGTMICTFHVKYLEKFTYGKPWLHLN